MAVAPFGTFTAVLLPDGVVIVVVPPLLLTTDHKPDVGAGSLPVTVNAGLLQFVWSKPASANGF